MTDRGLSDGKLKDLERAFAIFDKNQDGRITKDELESVFKEADVTFTEIQLEEFMKRVDLDGNGSIDYGEFCGIMKDLVCCAVEMEKKLRASFGSMDLDGDGKISEGELKQALCDLGEDVTIEEAREIIETVDRDGDGHINYEEFVTMMYVLQIGQ